ncbi:hypothetical protein [Lutispora saccharofermentans]|uniref:HEAT repeat domain-containing protein n=1 Tax=Lutispora saccharofermentans TaxID=3024236 RepID=A0ABT1NJH9_9FIRM|nr:hypothetical protein [Lutispora saccharofermentans]MCQ1530041.1 hypothetical protein [Lutispora saccharofermentans]
MITIDELISIDKSALGEAAKNLCKEDLPMLVRCLEEKDDDIRYKALLLLQHRSLLFDDVYPFWDKFCEKLRSSNSYHRSIGLMLIAENTRWDCSNKIDVIIDDYLSLLNDEKPITKRQCIQSLTKIIPYKPHLLEKIAGSLMDVKIDGIRETMRKLVLIDILEALVMIRKYDKCSSVDDYIFSALTGGLLDKKSIKHFESIMGLEK